MSKRIVLKPILVSENRFTGARRWKLNARDTSALMKWSGFDVSKVRGSRGVRKDGTLHFTTGLGYAVIDADLLGGNGDGKAEKLANDADIYFRY